VKGCGLTDEKYDRRRNEYRKNDERRKQKIRVKQMKKYEELGRRRK